MTTIRTYAARYLVADLPVDVRRGDAGEYRGVADWIALPDGLEGDSVSVELFKGSGTRTFTVVDGVKSWNVPEQIQTVASSTGVGDVMFGTGGALPQFEVSRHGQPIRVPDLAALLTLSNLAAGTEVMVTQPDDVWVRQYGAHTADGNFVLAATGGGFWIRAGASRPDYRLVQTWYWDAVAGDDSNDGLTTLTPVKTHREIMHRVNQGGPTAGYAVAVMSTSTEDIRIDPRLNGVAFVYYEGPGGPFLGIPGTVLYSGTVGTYVPFDPATKTEARLTDPDMTATAVVGKLARVTSGPRAGAQWWFYEDTDTHEARVSEPKAGIADQTTVVLQAGDTFNVYEVAQLTGLLSCQPQTEGGQIAFSSLLIGSEEIPHNTSIIGGVYFFDSCWLYGFDISGSSTLVQAYNCWTPTGCRVEGGSNLIKFGGVGGVAVRYFSVCTMYNVVCNDTSPQIQFAPGYLEIPANYWVACIGSEDGLGVSEFGHVFCQGRLWGKEVQSPGVGLRIRAGGKVLYSAATPPDIDAAGGDCLIGGTAKAYEDLPFDNPSNGASVRTIE